MKIATIHGTTFRVHPLLPLLLILYVLSGQSVLIAAALLTLLLHECGHYFVARRMGLPVSQIELTPFGGSMQIDLAEGVQGAQGILLAAAGIAVNALCLALTAVLLRQKESPSPFLNHFLLLNLSMLAINLLPVLPLDGGRILLCFLSPVTGHARALRVLLLLGRILAAGMIGWAAALALRGNYQPIWALLGCYLFYASALEERHSTARYFAALFTRRDRLCAGQALPLHTLCATPQLSLYALLPQLQPHAYHRIEVLDEANSEIIGTLEEPDLFRAVLDTPAATLSELLHMEK